MTSPCYLTPNLFAKKATLSRCTGPDWDGVNFLHSSPCGAVFCICDQNSVDNTPAFWLLLSSASTASKLSLFPSFLHLQNCCGFFFAFTLPGLALILQRNGTGIEGLCRCLAGPTHNTHLIQKQLNCYNSQLQNQSPLITKST